MIDWKEYRERQSFYQGKKWQDMRIYILYRDKTCMICSTEEHPVMAEEVDHIIDIVDRPDLRLDPQNLQGLCKSCHSKKTFETHLKGAWKKTSNIEIAKKKWSLSLDSQSLGKCSIERSHPMKKNLTGN